MLTSSSSCLGYHLLFLNEEEFHLGFNRKCFGPFPLSQRLIYVILKESVGQKRNRKKL